MIDEIPPGSAPQIPSSLAAPVSSLEIQEHLFSQTSAATVLRIGDMLSHPDRLQASAKDLRQMLRLHRFMVMTWLVKNGVQLPVALIADTAHPEVGSQAPDRPAPPAPDAG